MPPKYSGGGTRPAQNKPEFRGYRKPPGLPVRKEPAKKEIPILRPDIVKANGEILKSNVTEWFKIFSIEARSEFGLLGMVIDTRVYPDIPDIEYEEEDTTAENDPHGFYKDQLREQYKSVQRDRTKMESDKLKLYAKIESYCSADSMDKIKMHESYTEELATYKNDPATLLDLIRQTHLLDDVRDTYAGADAMRDTFAEIKQMTNESIVKFKERFDDGLNLLKEYELPNIPSQKELAASFLRRLDNGRYAAMKATTQNNISAGIMSSFDTVAEAYFYASSFKVVSNSTGAISRTSGSQSSLFVTTAEDRRATTSNSNNTFNKNKNKKFDKKVNREFTNKKTAGNRPKGKKSDQEANYTCKLCTRVGHYERNCDKLDECACLLKASASAEIHTTIAEEDIVEEENVDLAMEEQRALFDSDAMFMMESAAAAVEDVIEDSLILHQKIASSKLSEYAVLLDNQASKPLFHCAKLLSDIRTAKYPTTFRGVGGSFHTSEEGFLPNFGWVCYHPSAPANVLPMSYVEDMDNLKIKYTRKVGFTITFDNGVVWFFKRIDNGLCVADFEEYAHEDEAYVHRVEDTAKLYTKREYDAAKTAREFQERLGFPSDADMIKMIQLPTRIYYEVSYHCC
jgi:hypothetical protein